MKRSLLFLVVFTLIFSTFSFSAKAAGFKDLTESHRFYEEMLFLESEGVISGYTDSTFRPDEEVTRAAAAIMIGRALRLSGEQRATKFSDVGANQKASGYIASAVEKGIISGFPDGTYRPHEFVTRGQMAIFLSRAFQLTEEAAASFTDVSPNMSAYVYIKRILAEKITAGYPNNTYRPNVDVTRAQFSAFLARALDDRFKVEVPRSYAMDQSKVYHYHADEVGTIVYKFSGEQSNGWNVWEVYEGGKKVDARMVEREDSNGYYFSYMESEGVIEEVMLLKYPVKVGQSWPIGPSGSGKKHTITSMTKTITTPAGTFRNVVEVTDKDGTFVYYAPNVGRIKSVINGAVILELAELTNR
ncbi:S-layer homology domain-containing protein [Bacillus aerolatus]|nr:S-layer homology domain-containing protein [Bacillus aerolatus]